MNHQVKWTDEKVARFWDFESQFPNHYFASGLGGAIVLAVRRYLSGGRTVLDFGCGPGGLIGHLLNEGLRVSASDFSEASVASVGKRYENAPGFEGAYDTPELLNSGKTFDAVIAVEVIEHLTDDQLQSTFGSIKSLLAPQGYAIFTTPNDENLDEMSILCPDCGAVFHRYQHMRSWNRASLEEFVRRSGFKVVEVMEMDFYDVRRPWSLGYIKRIVRQAIGQSQLAKKPHLVCVCSLP